MNATTSYEVKLENWKGPIEALLDLIEEKQLNITDVNLAALTNDFLNLMEKVPPREIADFLVVAAQLMLIKSRILLPTVPLTNEEKEGIKDLARRLRLLRFLRRYSREISARWEDPGREFSKPFLKGQPVVFYPAANITRESLMQALQAAHNAVAAQNLAMQTIPKTLISLEEKIREIISRFTKTKSGISFDRLAASKNKQEIVVLFLAVLHLLERRAVKIRQSARFGSIMLYKKRI